jgi:phage gp36-like protein
LNALDALNLLADFKREYRRVITLLYSLKENDVAQGVQEAQEAQEAQGVQQVQESQAVRR